MGLQPSTPLQGIDDQFGSATGSGSAAVPGSPASAMANALKVGTFTLKDVRSPRGSPPPSPASGMAVALGNGGLSLADVRPPRGRGAAAELPHALTLGTFQLPVIPIPSSNTNANNRENVGPEVEERVDVPRGGDLTDEEIMDQLMYEEGAAMMIQARFRG